MKTCECNYKSRIITGTVVNYDEECVKNATVVLSTLSYCDCCGVEIIENIGYTTTNDCGVYVFNINILDYINMDFILEVYNPLKKI